MAASPYPDRILYRRFLQLLRPYWPYMAGIVLLDLLAPPCVIRASAAQDCRRYGPGDTTVASIFTAPLT